MTTQDDRVDRLTPERRLLLERALLARKAAGTRGIPRRERVGPVPLSYSQQRLWFLDRLDPDSATYNASLVNRLIGPLDIAALQTAIAGLVQRHEPLRTAFISEDGEPRQVVLTEASPELRVVDVSGADDAAILSAVETEVRRPFDLERDVLLRALLLRVGVDDHVLVLTVHHIACDGWSRAITYSDLAELYAAQVENRPDALTSLAVRYTDYAEWQRERLSAERLERELQFWRGALAGAPTALQLPTDKPRPTVQSFSGAHEWFTLPGELASSLGALARARGATPFMALLAAFGVLLSRVCGQDDVLVGSPVANRQQAELAPLVGFFVNTLVLRVAVADEASYLDLIDQVRGTTTSAFAHQEVPFELIVDALRLPRDASRNPLFQVNFRVNSGQGAVLQLPGLTTVPMTVEQGSSRFDLAMELEYHADNALGGYVEYNLELFEPATIRRLVAQFREVLTQLVQHPSEPIGRLPLAVMRTTSSRSWG
jgi:hypothetical protein